MINKNDYDHFMVEFPTIAESGNGLAVISHIMENPNINYPFCSDKERNEIVKELKSKGYTFLPQKKGLKFIDLFAGIGGIRSAFESAGCECIFSSEWDEKCKQTYLENYHVQPFGDITKIPKNEIPDHDILCAGFPCQPFSIAGVSKKNSMGRATGFADKTQGTLFFDIVDILRNKRPKAFFLENVKNLCSHDKGKTWKIIQAALKELNYDIFWQIVDGQKWVPQHRERIFIVGFDKSLNQKEFSIPTAPNNKYEYKTLDKIISYEGKEKYTLSEGTWLALQRHKQKHLEKGNGFGYSLIEYPVKSSDITKTISARYYKDGAEILIQQKNIPPRKLSIEEAMQLQGFDPTTFKFKVGASFAYKQIGNSVVIPAVRETAIKMVKVLKSVK